MRAFVVAVTLCLVLCTCIYARRFGLKSSGSDLNSQLKKIGDYTYYPDISIITALRKHGQHARFRLERIMKERDPHCVGPAALYLGMLGDQKALPQLMSSAVEGNVYAVDAIGDLALESTGTAESALMKVVRDPRLVFHPWNQISIDEFFGHASRNTDLRSEPRALEIRFRAARVLRKLIDKTVRFAGDDCFYSAGSPMHTINDQWEAEGGEWSIQHDVIKGRALRGAVRLWLRSSLPQEYVISSHITTIGGTAGFSYGHMKNFHAQHDRIFTGTSIDNNWLTLEVTKGCIECIPLPIGERRRTNLVNVYWVPDHCSMLVRSRRDIGNRIALYVESGQAEFRCFTIRRPVPCRALELFLSFRPIGGLDGSWHTPDFSQFDVAR